MSNLTPLKGPELQRALVQLAQHHGWICAHFSPVQDIRGVWRTPARADGKGRILAAEIMIVNAAIREYINDPEKTSEILINIETCREQYGMQSFDQAILDLVNGGIVTVDEGIKNATSPNDFKVKLRLK